MVLIDRGWDEKIWGPRPYSEEWWMRRDARWALRRAVASTQEAT